MNKDINIVIDVKDVILLVTKQAVTIKELSKISLEEALNGDDEVINDILDHYEKYFSSKEEVNNTILSTQNFFGSIDTAVYPPMDVIHLIEKNNMRIIYMLEDNIPKREKFETLIKSKLKGCILLNSRDTKALYNIDFAISANETLLRDISAKRKILIDMPYNKDISEFIRLKEWKEVLQFFKKCGIDTSNVSKARFT